MSAHASRSGPITAVPENQVLMPSSDVSASHTSARHLAADGAAVSAGAACVT